MAEVDNRYSRLVVWLKIVLPLIALGMLSSIFLVSRSIDPTATLPYSQTDLDNRAREPRLTTPRFTGVTSDGALVTIDASEMRPEILNPNKGSAKDLRGQMEAPDGAVTHLTADAGHVDKTAGTYELTGSVVITHSAGYRIAAPRMTGLLDATALDATETVVTDGPMGRITADTMRLRADPKNPGQYLLVFKDRVRLIYQPAK